MAGTVAVVGSFNVDHVWTLDALPIPGETRSGAYSTGPGGKGFNQAVACARSGAATRFVCALGDDAGGVLARALAAAEDIDLRDACVDAPTGSAGIFVDAAGRNSIVVALGANARMSAAHVTRELEESASLSVVLVQLETPADAAHAALQQGHARGAITMLNPAPADAIVTPALLAIADVLTPNETEFAALLATHVQAANAADGIASLDDGTLHAACRALLPHGTVVVTLGAAGAFVSHPAGARRGDPDAAYRLGVRDVRVRDTTGAGDAFSGALAASLALDPKRPFARHAAYAMAYAGLSTEIPGAAVSMPSRATVVQRFDDLAT
jgi:ribokinase